MKVTINTTEKTIQLHEEVEFEILSEFMKQYTGYKLVPTKEEVIERTVNHHYHKTDSFPWISPNPGPLYPKNPMDWTPGIPVTCDTNTISTTLSEVFSVLNTN